MDLTDLKAVTLDDKYTLDRGRVFLTGIQALTRLPMMQRLRDEKAGHNTAGYISGYRGSPLGTYDQQLWQARALLEKHHIKFQAGVNEELAATACWGTQQAQMRGEGKYDGVFAIWYGKGPGVDRTGDAFKHGNNAGSSPLGGVLALLGDDHTAESSTAAHSSEYAMVDAMMPILNPAGVQEILDYGIYGWALSRYSGCWVGIKCVHDTVNTAATVDVDNHRIQIQIPTDFTPPADGLHVRWPDTARAQEARLHNYKHNAVRAFARANRLDKTVIDAPNAKIGIVATGKSYLDARTALDLLGLDDARLAQRGVRLYKVALVYPLEPVGIKQFVDGLDLVICIEEKRGIIESQLKEILYGTPNAPRVIGKEDESGAPLFMSSGALDANHIAGVLGRRIMQIRAEAGLTDAIARCEKLFAGELHAGPGPVRTPHFCPGCPHNTGTKVPEGSMAMAGIGCHFMAVWMDRNTSGFTQMGAEGAGWMGEAPFSKTKHVFQNIGDGTYYHSGLLAIRALAASGVNVTYKILYNDAVAMTGGQQHDGPLTVPQITLQVYAEGAKKIAVVTDEPDKYGAEAEFAPGVKVYHRDDYDAVQREFREVAGLSAIVYDQTCAAEKRRRRKRGKFPDPQRRVVINEQVCEGCGDCGVQSNCIAVAPLETEFGRKRAIDQSACNKDFSCLKGFCPSFVTVEGGRLRKGKASSVELVWPALPEPALPALDRPYSIAITGIGGTGVITIGALIGMAAHLEGKGCGVLDMAGLAQKGGAVTSHLRVARTPEDIKSTRIPAGGADLLIGGDVLVSGGHETLAILRQHATRAVINTQQSMTGEFARKPDFDLPWGALEQSIVDKVGRDRVDFINASRLATALMGDSLATNLFLVGYAFQKGWLPVSSAALERAIELNGAAVEMNKQAFLWGRRAVVDLAQVEKTLTASPVPKAKLSQSLDELIVRRVEHLTGYQNAAYAKRYRQLVERVRQTEAQKVAGSTQLTAAVARYYAKLMAYKDEYEVARLYTEGEFQKKIGDMFEGDFKLTFHMAPPIIEKRNTEGVPLKRRFGPWMWRALGLIAKMKGLRGSALDVFGYSHERRTERQLIEDYERLVEQILGGLNESNHATAVELASIPEHIRGYGHVKQRHLQQAKRREAELLAAFASPGVRPQAKAA
jgi:indolepyruvate ferredoxin oxidoreductase